MDIHDIRGVMSALILIVFIGLFVWVSLGGRDRFREAAALPFDEDADTAGTARAQEPQA